MLWTVVIPMRALPSAKSRLRDAASTDELHARLVDAIRTDTLDAVGSSTLSARIVLAVDQQWPGVHIGHEIYVQRAPGLNAALEETQAWAESTWPSDGVVALVGDLPALRASDLDDALAEAADHDRSFVTDLQGLGTTMLAARPGVELRPAFGPGSSNSHGLIAFSLTAARGLRCDVDTVGDLELAVQIGVGPSTAAFLAAETILPLGPSS